MTFSEHWRNLQKSNPHLTDEFKLTLDVSTFKELLELSYNEGLKAGTVSSQISVHEQIFGKPKTVRPISLFESIFGGWH